MRLRMLSVVSFGLYLLSACASSTHFVDVDRLSFNNHKMFQIGIIKVVGRSPYPWVDYSDKKMAALDRIPVEGICQTLARNYGVQIDRNYDKKIRTVKEFDGGGQSRHSTTSPYRGNQSYEQRNTGEKILLEYLLTVNPSIINQDSGNWVYITYGFDYPSTPFVFSNEIYYNMMVKTDDMVLIEHKGTVAVVDMPMDSLGMINHEGVWDNFIAYADKINVALINDINKYSTLKKASLN